MEELIKKGCIFVNGCLLSPGIIYTLNFIQTGGTLYGSEWNGHVPAYTGEVLSKYLTNLSVLEQYFTQQMIDDRDTVNEMLEYLEKLNGLRFIMEGLKLP